MADFEGNATDTFDRIQLVTAAFWTPNSAPSNAPSPSALTTFPSGGALDTGDPGFAPVITDFEGALTPNYDEFFLELVWTKPGRIELGNIISTVTREMEIYNAYRDDSRSLTAATPNAGAGVSFQGLPGLPATILRQSGVTFNVVVSTSGPATIDGTLDFTLDSGTLVVPITGTRVVIFPFEPEAPIRELLQFKTNILRSVDGSEQRVSTRKHPRQLFEMSFRLEEDEVRQRLQALLFGAQAGILGLPMWHEGRRLTAAASATDTVINVGTDYGDFRADSLVILWKSPTEFEAQEISSLTASTITISSPLEGNYPVQETLVMPLRTARGEKTVAARKYIKNLEELQLRFTVTDNEADIGSTAAFGTHDGKVMLDGSNWIGSSSTIKDDITTRLQVIDNETAPINQFTDWNNAEYSSTKGFIATTSQELWEVRQLVHALRGSQVSFYVPTFYSDITAAADLGSGSDQITIENIGYTDFVGGSDPFGALWLLKTDGTVVTRSVTAAAEVDEATERLTVDAVWGTLITTAEIDRISFLRLSRIENDEVQINHIRVGEAQIVMPTVGVQQ